MQRRRLKCATRGGSIFANCDYFVHHTYGKNRIRFPGKEKRINMLLSLEPLIYFESITNGESILAKLFKATLVGNGKFMTAFSAARSQHFTAISRFHTFAEPMN